MRNYFALHWPHEPPGPAPHHDDHGRRPAERRLLRRRPGPAPGEEDGQLRRAGGVPPLLRRRDRLARLDPDLVRVRRRAPPAARARQDPHDHARRPVRGRARVLGRAGRRHAASPTPTACSSSSWSPTATSARRTPTYPTSTPSIASWAPAHTAPTPTSRRRSSPSPRLRLRGRGDVHAGRLHVGLRPGDDQRPPGRRQRAPHRVGVRRRGPPRLAAAHPRRRRLRHRRQGPRLLQVDLLPEPRGVLFEIATLSPGFAVDEDPEHLGEALKLPTQHEHLRERLERTLGPAPVAA